MNNDSEVLDVVLCGCGKHENDDSAVPPCQSAEHWTYALTQIRSSIYNSTSVTLPNPGHHIMEYDKRVRSEAEHQQFKDAFLFDNSSLFKFNSEPLASNDIFSYRRQRSEHILLRIYHHFFYNQFQNLIRLSKGVFLSQKWEVVEEEQTYPSPTTLENAMNLVTSEDLQGDINSIDTFSFNDIFGMMQEQQQQQQQVESTTKFVPFSYTMGVRFTNHFNDFRDVVVRGNIPLWCQIIFISSCLQQTEPIQPGTRRKGLLPFAMDISFSFTTCPIPAPSVNTSSQVVIEPYPLHTVLFERMCMELSEPEMIMNDKDIRGISWYERQESILRGILLCDIPDALASAITEMANAWAANQGIVVE